MMFFRLIGAAALALLLWGGLFAAQAQQGVPNGCAAGIPTSAIFGFGLGIPGGCGPGIPTASSTNVTPPTACAGSGTLDLSDGCYEPWLGIM
jgi:hypothetical protein